MSNDEAITKLTNVLNDDIYSWSPAILTAFGMAVDALRQSGQAEPKEMVCGACKNSDSTTLYCTNPPQVKCKKSGKLHFVTDYCDLPSAQSTQTNTPNALNALDCIDRQADCEYCHKDSDGYVKPIEKNCHAFIRFGMNGWEISLSAKGWHGETKINYCPMCGRRLE